MLKQTNSQKNQITDLNQLSQKELDQLKYEQNQNLEKLRKFEENKDYKEKLL